MSDLVVVGTSLFGEVAAAYFDRLSDRKVVSFASDPEFIDSDNFAGRDVVSIERMKEEFPPSEVEVFVAIGYRKMNSLRRDKCEELIESGYSLASFVHPSVDIWDTTELGQNVFIFEDNTVQPFTGIGDGTILWSGNHIGHHSRIDSYTFISSHVVISGSCSVGSQCFFGVNSTVYDGVSIGDRCIVGGGSIVAKDLESDSLVSARRTPTDSRKTYELDF